MIKFIIGENASGKTLYLDNCIEKELVSNEEINFVTNLRDGNYAEWQFNQERLDILEDISDSDKVDISNQILYLSGSPVKLSEEFLKLMTLLCKDCKKAYIDEPEQGLSEYEINLLASFLQYTQRTFEEIIIVTHSELLIQITSCICVTPKMSETTAYIELIEVPEEKKFEVID